MPRGRPYQPWSDRIKNLKYALSSKKIGSVSNTSAPPRGLSVSNAHAFRILAGCAAGQAEYLREALILTAHERPESGLEQILVQLVGRHGLAHLYDVNDFTDFSILPGVVPLQLRSQPANPQPTQLQLAGGLQSHALFKSDVVVAGKVVVHGDVFSIALEESVCKCSINTRNLQGFSFSLLIAAYSRFVPFAQGIMGKNFTSVGEVLQFVLTHMDENKSLVGIEGIWGHKQTSHTYDLSTFTVKKFLLRAARAFLLHPKQPKLSKGSVVLSRVMCSDVLGCLVSNHTVAQEGYFDGLSKVTLVDDYEVRTSSADSAKANAFACAYNNRDDWNGHARALQALMSKQRKPGRGHLKIQTAIESLITGAFAQSAACKTTQRILAPYSQSNWTRLKRRMEYTVPRCYVISARAKRAVDNFRVGAVAKRPAMGAKAKRAVLRKKDK